MAVYSRNKNSRGDQVKSIQESLNTILFQLSPQEAPANHTQQEGLKLDGIYGPRTEYCVLAVQRAYNISYKIENDPLPPEDIPFRVKQPTTTQTTTTITSTQVDISGLVLIYEDVDEYEDGQIFVELGFEDSNGVEYIGEGNSINRNIATSKARLDAEQKYAAAQPPPPEGETPLIEESGDQEPPPTVVQQDPPYSTTYTNDQVSNDQFQTALSLYLDLAYWNRPDYPLTVDEDGIVGPDTAKILNIVELPKKDPDRLRYKGRLATDENEPVGGVKLNVSNNNFTAIAFSNDDGTFEFDLGGTFDPSLTKIEFDSSDYFPKTISNVLQSAQERIDGEIIYIFEMGTIRLVPVQLEVEPFEREIQIQIQKIENQEIEVGNKPTLPFGAKIGILFNKLKERLKRLLIPIILGLLAKFGARFLRQVLDRVPNPIPDTCPTPAELLALIRKRNQLVRQINKLYEIVEKVSKVLKTVRVVLTAIKIGFTIAKLLPLARPTGLISDGIATIKRVIDKSGIAINFLIIIVIVIGVLLQTLLDLLNSLDGAIQHCAEDDLSNIPFERINDELSRLAGGVIEETQNSSVTPGGDIQGGSDEFDVNDFIPEELAEEQGDVYQAVFDDLQGIFPEGDAIQGILSGIATTNPNLPESNSESTGNAFRGFTFEIKLDPKSNSKYPKRFAQALNVSGVPVLKSDSSFASNPQVLIDQLKFIIESQGLRGD